MYVCTVEIRSVTCPNVKTLTESRVQATCGFRYTWAFWDTFPVDTGDYCISMMQFPFAFFTPPKTTAIPHFCFTTSFHYFGSFIHFYDAILASLYSLLNFYS